MAEGEVALLYEDEEEQQKQEQTKAEDGAEDTKDVPAVMVKEEARAESSAHACSAEEEADRSAEGNVVHQGTAGTELKMEGTHADDGAADGSGRSHSHQSAGHREEEVSAAGESGPAEAGRSREPSPRAYTPRERSRSHTPTEQRSASASRQRSRSRSRSRSPARRDSGEEGTAPVPKQHGSGEGKKESKDKKRRYFLVRALCPDNVMISIQEGAWAVPAGLLEDKLEAAYASGETRLLIVVADSMCFSGWAVMRGRVGRLGKHVPWAVSCAGTRKLGGPFAVAWRCLYDLPAPELEGITNAMDGNRPVLQGKDVCEMPEATGDQIVALMEAAASAEGVPPPKKLLRMHGGFGRGRGPGHRGAGRGDDMAGRGRGPPRDYMSAGRHGGRGSHIDMRGGGMGMRGGGGYGGMGMHGGGGPMGPMMGMMGGSAGTARPGFPGSLLPPPPPPPPRRPPSPSPERGPNLVDMSYDDYLEVYRKVKVKMEELKAAEAVVQPNTGGVQIRAQPPPGAPRPTMSPPMGMPGMLPGMLGGMGMVPGMAPVNLGMVPSMGGPMMGGMGALPPGMMGGGGMPRVPPGGMMAGQSMVMQQLPAGAQPYTEAEYVALTIKHFQSQGKQPPSEDYIRQHYRATLTAAQGH